MTAPAIALVQLLYLFILYVPMGWRRLALPRGMRIGMGYLVSNAIAMLACYALDMAGWFSAIRAFVLWISLCLGLNLLAWHHVPPYHRRAPAEKCITLLLAITMTLTIWIRLADPFRNIALSGTDSYQFINFYAWIRSGPKAIHDYPSGFALVTAIAPWGIDPYQAARWAPPLVFSACLTAAFGFWRRLGGSRFALGLTTLLGTAWFLYPITAYHPHFIQWTTVFVGMPALLVLYSRLARGGPVVPVLLLAIPVNMVFTMTSAYFALYLNAVLGILTLLSIRGKATALRTATALVSIMPPLLLLGFYGILARVYFSEWETGVALQSQAIGEVIQQAGPPAAAGPASGMTGVLAHPLIRLVAAFLTPAIPLNIGPRWGVYAGLITLGTWMWRQSPSMRHTGARLLAGLMILSTCSAMTGILELPGWQGRNVFIALFTGLAAILWTAIHRGGGMVRRMLHSPWAMGSGLIAIAGPSLLWPPMIGRNVPVAEVIHPRSIPSDNLVLRELTCATAPPLGGKKTLAMISSPDTPVHLIANLLRIHCRTRDHVFPAYSIIGFPTLAAAEAADALLFPEALLHNESLPGTFTVHTKGPGYIFATRTAPVKTHRPLRQGFRR